MIKLFKRRHRQAPLSSDSVQSGSHSPFKMEGLETRQMLNAVIDLQTTSGGKTVQVTSVGQVVNLNVWAIVTASGTDATDDGFQWAHGSFLSSDNTGGAAAGTLAASVNSNFGATSASNGSQVDLDGDGDLDVGSNNNDQPAGFFVARAGSPVAGTNPAPAKILIGTVSFTVTSLKAGTSTNINFRPRSNAPVETAGWYENAAFKNTSTGTFGAGAPVVLSRSGGGGGGETAPAAPGNLSASATSSSQITLNWADNSSNESRFEIWRSTDGTNFTLLAQTAGNATSFTNTGLTAGTTYFYRVRAGNTAGTSAFSNTASATPSGTTSGVPAAPANLNATAASSSQITLNWQDSSSNETRFEIFRSTNGTTFAWAAQVGANATSYTNSGLTAGTTYFYRVRAVNASGNSAWSNIASAAPTGGTPTTGVPAAPSNLAATSASASAITLNWQDNSTNEGRFEIFRSTNGTNFAWVAQVGANARTYTNSGLTTGTTYFYRVRAVNSSGNSGWSNISSAAPGGGGGGGGGTPTTGVPAAPTSLTARTPAAGQIGLTWLDNATNEGRYEIFRSTNGTNFSFLTQVGANATSYTNTGLAAGTTYWYRIRAVNSSGNSGWSNTVSMRAT